MQQEVEMKDFMRRIYTSWAPIEAKTHGRDDWDEMQTLHAMDLAIFQTGEKPARISQSDLGDFRKREGMNAKYREAYGQ